VHYVDAALGCNNPVRQVLNEAKLAYENIPVDCILSVGTGKPQIVGLPEPNAFQKMLPTKGIDVLKKLATDANRVAEELEQEYKNIPGIYFRLNVEQGMQGITLEEWKRLDEVTAHTRQYLQTVKVSKEVDDLVNALAGRNASCGVLVSELGM
jgi:myo-inositol-1-phosphate synthase